MNRQCPPEIIQLIVEASLDPYDFFTASINGFSTRYAILRSYSLVNSTWYGASQPELVRSVELYPDGAVVEFLEMAERRGGTVEGVRDLFVSAICDGDSTTHLLKSTPHLLNLYCREVRINVDDLAQLQRLRRLELFSVDITGSPSSSLLCLPHLQRLSMTDVTLKYSVSHSLTLAFLPRLRHVDICGDFGSIAPFIPQLEVITFDPYFVDYMLLSRATSLLLLPLPQFSRDRLAMFRNLPFLPPFLHINFTFYIGFDIDHEVSVALEQLLEAKNPGLRIILLNDYGFGDRVKLLIQRLQERPIRVQMVDKELDFEGAIKEMYRIRAKEERAMEYGGGRVG